MLRGLILVFWLLTLALNAPGHLTFDSVVQLTEGRTGAYAGAHPPFMSALLGLLDRIVPGTALYLLLATALFYLPLMALAGPGRPRGVVGWSAAVLLVAALASPLVLIDQGTVWKDVLFANLALSAFTCLVLAQRRDRTPARLALLAGAAVLAAFAAATRQNGAIVLLCAAVAVGLAIPATPPRRRLVAGLLWAAVAGAALVATQAALQASAAQPIGSGTHWGLTVLRRYDVAGMIIHGAPPYPDQPASSPDSVRVIESFRQVYDPSRIDTLKSDANIAAYFRGVEDMGRHWRRMIRQNPGAWLAHRAAVFGWMTAPPDVQRCLPVSVGIEGPSDLLTALEMEQEKRPQDVALYRYAQLFMGTPFFLNAAWGVLALGLAALLARRRPHAPGDAATVAMLVAALGFAASFAVIGIACDVRYLFFLPVACCGALAHLARPRPAVPAS